MQQVDYMQVAEKAMAQIKKGAFLTVKSEQALNTMTIGWATIGFVWHQPVLMVAVRSSRHTFSLIEKAADFTVSIPADNFAEEITFCGTKSGRDVDKFKALKLQTLAARKTISPVIKLAGLHFECRVVYKSAMDPALLSADLTDLYPQKDYHTLYFGQIQACYETD